MKINPLQRQLNLLDYALSSLWRRRMKNGAILAIFAFVIFLLGSFQLLSQTLQSSAEELLAFAPDITIQSLVAGRQTPIAANKIRELADMYGITASSPRIWGYYFDHDNGANYTVLGLTEEEIGAMTGVILESGRLPGAPGEVAVSPAVRQSLDLAGRSAFSLFRPDLSQASFKVSGLFSRETDIVTGDIILMSLADARHLFAMPEDMVTDIGVKVANPVEIDNVARKIAGRFPETRVLTRAQIRKTYQVVFGWRSGFGSVCLLAALASFVILASDKASGLSREEKREIGILKFLGFQTTDILALRFWESVVVAGLAFLIGLSLAYVHVAFFDGGLFKPVLVGWSVLRPDLSLAPSLNGADLLLIFSWSVLPYLAATIIPAWRSAVIRADTVV
ncbi:MAG: ABC transporter permease [Deltaproteobacteria bacterium]|nr:ABC transporter permease [Deltaproteobacteria bacterium]